KVSAHYDDNSLNGAGIVHGGFTFTLADFAGAVATNAYGFTTLSIDSSISYYNAPKCNNLVAVASEMQRSNRLSYITVCIHDDCGTHIADFKGTYYITKKEITIL
ncbi:MAG: PaaI family thioesterase, partial [Muribaculaceae bacterium]